MLIIKATNIHETAGKILLIDLIQSYCTQDIIHDDVILFIDKRCNIKIAISNLNVNVYEVPASIKDRLIAEFKIYLLSKKNPQAKVFCFGNLPPLFQLKSKVILYFHNVLYFKPYLQYTTSFKQKIKHYIERYWIKNRLRNVNEVIVQSDFVKDTFESEFLFTRIKVLAFNNQKEIKGYMLDASNKGEMVDKFVYISSGASHKNHLNLIEAWRLLAREGIYPILHLTVDSCFEHICREIENLKKSDNVMIVNHGVVSHFEAVNLSLSASALLFPSFCESLGLPLVEAKMLNIPVIASELDYVRDVIDPIESFNPTSPKSISRAVKRFLKISDTKLEVLTCEDLAGYLKKID